jgi:phenylacetate-CoA ligase
MTSAARLRFLLDNQATVVFCTPTYALRLAEVARQEGIDLPASGVTKLVLAGEPGGSIAGTRSRIEAAWGARVFDHSGMTEIGALGTECLQQPMGLHLLETECIAEVLDPANGLPIPPGGTGELVLTNLGRWGSPLIRYRTGDRVKVDPHACPCGRPLVWLPGGILGRIDDMIIVRGNNVYPAALENILRRYSQLEEFRIEVVSTGSSTELRLVLELSDEDQGEVSKSVVEAIRNELNFRPEVAIVPPGTLPRSEMKSRRVTYRSSV